MDKILMALVINQLNRMNLRTKKHLFTHTGSLDDLVAMKLEDLQRKYGWKGQSLSWSPMVDKARSQIQYCEKYNIKIALMGSDNYPELLENIYDPPLIIFTRGRALDRDFSGAAVVGTRKPSGEAIAQAFQVGLDLALRECHLVSGLALGVDGAAHKGSLAGMGWTVAVLASGVDRVYPLEHSGLARDILENGGTIVSEYPPGTEPARFRYPMRNRIISGLSSLSVVIQAPRRSGALITADYALQEGRDLFVGSAGLNTQGTARLVEEGAPLIQRGRDLVRLLGIDTEEQPGQRCQKPVTHRDMVTLLQSELKGNILPYGGQYYYGL